MNNQSSVIGSAVLVGATGFVGQAALGALRSVGFVVDSLVAPRLEVAFGADPFVAATAWTVSSPKEFTEIVAAMRGRDVCVNAAGLALPTESASMSLWGANAVLPVILALAAAAADCRRFVHVSSAAVQGSMEVLDEQLIHHCHSPYSTSKAAAESALAAMIFEQSVGDLEIVIYRPTSVLGASRPIAARLAQVLRSRWLAIPPSDPRLPVAHVDNVGRAISFIVELDDPPAILLHPWESMTVRTLASEFGRTTPICSIPAPVAGIGRRAVRLLARRGPLTGQARRIELLWEGQLQNSSLPDLGFAPADAPSQYAALGELLASSGRAT